MAITENEARYHVVCRRCTTERVFDTGRAADEFLARHAADSGHRIVVERVD